MNVKSEIYKSIRETLELDYKKIDHSVPWQELGVESFDMVELILSLREKFGIKVNSGDLEKITTLNDLIDFVEHHR